MVDNNDELSSITIGTGFGSITDIKTGPDGFLYIYYRLMMEIFIELARHNEHDTICEHRTFTFYSSMS